MFFFFFEVYENLCRLLIIRTETIHFTKFVFAKNKADQLMTHDNAESLNKIRAPIKE